MEKFESVIDRMSFIEMDKLSKELQKKVAEVQSQIHIR